MANLLQRLGNLIHIRFVLGLIAHVGIRSGYLRLSEFHRRRLGRQTVSGSRRSQLGKRTDISRVKLRHLHRLVALKHIQLSDLFLDILIYIVNHIIRLQDTGIYLNQR